MGFQSPDISMVDRRSHVPARLHFFKDEDHPETHGVDWPSHINVFGHDPRPLTHMVADDLRSRVDALVRSQQDLAGLLKPLRDPDLDDGLPSHAETTRLAVQ